MTELPRILFEHDQANGSVRDTGFHQMEKQELADKVRRNFLAKLQDLALRCDLNANF